MENANLTTLSAVVETNGETLDGSSDDHNLEYISSAASSSHSSD